MDSRSLKALKAASWAKNARRGRIVPPLRVKRSKLPKNLLDKIADDKPKKQFKQSWRTVGGRKVFFRSAWEANFGRYLQWQKERKMIAEWEHEPQTFWFEGIKRGCVTYLPDFKVTNLDGSHQWIEVKGFMDAKSKTKIARFKKFYPKESLRIVDQKWYKANSQKLSSIVPEWEKG